MIKSTTNSKTDRSAVSLGWPPLRVSALVKNRRSLAVGGAKNFAYWPQSLAAMKPGAAILFAQAALNGHGLLCVLYLDGAPSPRR